MEYTAEEQAASAASAVTDPTIDTALDVVTSSAKFVSSPQEAAGVFIEELGPLDASQLASLLSYVNQVAAAAKIAKRAIEERIADQLRENNAMRWGDSIIRVGQSSVWKVKEPEALARYIGDDWMGIVNLKAQGAVTKTRLEALAKERRAEDGRVSEDFLKGYAEMVLDTFMEREAIGGPITVLPVEKATKRAQRLEDGETLYPVGKREIERQS